MVYLLAFCALMAAFVWWRWTSVARGMRSRDALLMQTLGPIGLRLERGEDVPAFTIHTLVRQPQFRPMAFAMLSHFKRRDLFPEECLDIVSEGQGQLAYWMMHPNELAAAAGEIELLETCERVVNAEPLKFLVFKYRMPPGHWQGRDWCLGLAGPFGADHRPYESGVTAFARVSDKLGTVEPSALVDWYIATTPRVNESAGSPQGAGSRGPGA